MIRSVASRVQDRTKKPFLQHCVQMLPNRRTVPTMLRPSIEDRQHVASIDKYSVSDDSNDDTALSMATNRINVL
jgi:hypothetical protein